MADEKREEEGVYGENEPIGYGTSPSGVREETVQAHPNMTGDEKAAEEANDGIDQDDDKSVAQELDEVREQAAYEAGSGGMGRDGTPRNPNDAPQGQFGGTEEETIGTPG